MPATYASLSNKERIKYHIHAIGLHAQLEELVQRYAVALTAQEKTALRNAATPLLTKLSAWTYDSVAGTDPD